MSYASSRSFGAPSRNFEQRPFRSRDGRELQEDFQDDFRSREENDEDSFSVFEQDINEPKEQNFEPQFLSDEEEEEVSVPSYQRSRSQRNVEQEFDKPIKKKTKKAPAKIGYLGIFDWKGLSGQEKFARVGWIFVCFLFTRLVFMDSGVIDYIKMEKRLDARLGDLKSIQVENNDILNEIDLIKNNTAYQKKLVRDHLGAIDSNEYLILFPTESESIAN